MFEAVICSFGLCPFRLPLIRLYLNKFTTLIMDFMTFCVFLYLSFTTECATIIKCYNCFLKRPSFFLTSLTKSFKWTYYTLNLCILENISSFLWTCFACMLFANISRNGLIYKLLEQMYILGYKQMKWGNLHAFTNDAWITREGIKAHLLWFIRKTLRINAFGLSVFLKAC